MDLIHRITSLNLEVDGCSVGEIGLLPPCLIYDLYRRVSRVSKDIDKQSNPKYFSKMIKFMFKSRRI